MRCFRFDKLQIFFTCLQVVESRSDPNLSEEDRFPVMTMACGLIYQELVDTVAKLEQELTDKHQAELGQQGSCIVVAFSDLVQHNICWVTVFFWSSF